MVCVGNGMESKANLAIWLKLKCEEIGLRESGVPLFKIR